MADANTHKGMLVGKVALVTGAAHPLGIGRAIADAYLAEAATVVVTDLAGAQGLEETGGIACDVTDPGQAQAAVREVLSRHGRLDVLVNNAGVGIGSADFLELTAQDWDTTLDVNVKGIANMCAAAIPHMQQQGGSIINVASLAGLGAMDAIPACYTASKFAAVGLSKALSLQYAAEKIRVNAICPGSVVTQMHGAVIENLMQEHGIGREEAEALEASHIPLGRSAQPKEIASTAVFLASDLSSYLTGAAIPVAGGMAPGL